MIIIEMAKNLRFEKKCVYSQHRDKPIKLNYERNARQEKKLQNHNHFQRPDNN